MTTHGDEKGFLLIEALVAILVIVLGISVCFHALSQNAKVSETIITKSRSLETLKLQQLKLEWGTMGKQK